jgi:hypothetical protein
MYSSSTSQKNSLPLRLTNHEIHDICSSSSSLLDTSLLLLLLLSLLLSLLLHVSRTTKTG